MRSVATCAPVKATAVQETLVASGKVRAPVTKITSRAYRIPTETPEADGTLDWRETVLVIAWVEAGGVEGMGYSYTSPAAAIVINETLHSFLPGLDAFDIPRCWQRMVDAVRNLESSGIAACAVSAVDNALWDVKAKLLGLPLIDLLGRARDAIALYGSGGFTGESATRVARDIENWSELGITRYKIKIGRNEKGDRDRIAAAHAAMPAGGRLMVDANGAYQPKQALAQAERMSVYDIAWFEEPVPSNDVAGLQFIRARAPACMQIAAGEYGSTDDDFRRLLESQAVDALQADATRCLGITGFLRAAGIAASHRRPFSAHCAPTLHAAPMCHAATGIHSEYFADHVRIERMLFDGVPTIRDGYLVPQTQRPGIGIELKTQDAEKFAV